MSNPTDPNALPQPRLVPQIAIEDAYNILAEVIQDAPVRLRDHDTVLVSMQVIAQFIQDHKEG